MQLGTNTPVHARQVNRVVRGKATSDGAGVRLTRVIGGESLPDLDPFLLLDEFGSDKASDYLAGFPNHPHRGFETVTHMLAGRMRHRDNQGNSGLLTAGSVQWMTAGRGIIHSEMPQQEHGRMRGFQLWVNLPAREKMKPAGYRDLQPAEIPVVEFPGGGRAKVIAGTLVYDENPTPGPIQNTSTDTRYFDIELPGNAVFAHRVEAGHSVFVYPFEGNLRVGQQALATHSAGVLGPGERIEVAAGGDGARFLLLAGRPLREPVAQYGPFVMNTRAEIEQAIRDYQSGALTRAG